MNLPFGLPAIKDTYVKKKDDSLEAAIMYEQKLAEYRDALESYKRCILEYSDKLNNYDRRTVDNQLSIVQTALDITYLKEQGDKSVELLEDMKAVQLNSIISNLDSLIKAIVDTNYKVDGLDKNVVNRLSELMIELQKQILQQDKQLSAQLQSQLTADIEALSRNVKRNQALLWFLFAFSLLGMSGLAFMILYILEIIPF
jgi:hypothetical protein